jgi:hypothetical protein
MHSILNVLGIKSNVALINSQYDKEAFDPLFPCSQFDHVILCIPQPKDSIWLVCTSKTNNFAVLGSFTENKNALLITEAGGMLVPTPTGRASANIFSYKTYVTINENSIGTAKTFIYVTGEYKESFVHNLFEEKSDDQKCFLLQSIKYKQPDEFTVTKKEEDGKTKAAIELSFEETPYFTAGCKTFLGMSMYKLFSFDLPKTDNRRLNYFFIMLLKKQIPVFINYRLASPKRHCQKKKNYPANMPASVQSAGATKKKMPCTA